MHPRIMRYYLMIDSNVILAHMEIKLPLKVSCIVNWWKVNNCCWLLQLQVAHEIWNVPRRLQYCCIFL